MKFLVYAPDFLTCQQLSALVNLQWEMLETPCSMHMLHCTWTRRTLCQKQFLTAHNATIVFTCFGFCNREEIKHPVTLDLALFQI